MEIQEKNRFVEFVKKYGIFIVVGIVIFAVALTFTLVAALHKAVPTGNTRLDFKSPMNNATVIKDFSNTELQLNDTLNQWEAHLYVDFASEDASVNSVLDGVVLKIDEPYLEGKTITIQHANGFTSIYSSLSDDVLVKVGDTVTAGQKIAEVDNTAAGELAMGAHLHFALKLNNNFVDPNDYLDLQVK